jgi:hypothetical protein
VNDNVCAFMRLMEPFVGRVSRLPSKFLNVIRIRDGKTTSAMLTFGKELRPTTEDNTQQNH